MTFRSGSSNNDHGRTGSRGGSGGHEGGDGSYRNVLKTLGSSLTAHDIGGRGLASLGAANNNHRPSGAGAPVNTGNNSGSIAPSFENHGHMMNLPKHW